MDLNESAKDEAVKRQLNGKTDLFKGLQGEESMTLSLSQKAKIEKNRQKALLLKKARASCKPYPDATSHSQKTKVPSRSIDSGGGFFIDDDDEGKRSTQLKVTHLPGPVMSIDNLICESCEREFMESKFHSTFNVLICSECGKDKEKHPLITKSDAKDKYMLKDADFDRREPPLKFIMRKNPHNPNWGEMKLYLEEHVSERSLEVWGNEDKMDEERERRTDSRDKVKRKKYDKKVKELRNAIRSSLWKKDLGPHEHEFGEETYDDEEDVYKQTCGICGHVKSYEKM